MDKENAQRGRFRLFVFSHLPPISWPAETSDERPAE